MKLRRLRYVRPVDLGVFFLWLSLLIPMFFFYGEHRIRDFFIFKLIFLFLAQIMAVGRLKLRASSLLTSMALIVIFVSFVFANNFSQEKIIVLLTIILPLLYYQLTRQLEIRAETAIFMLGVACAISVVLSLINLGIAGNWRVGAVYIGGHFSTPLLVLSVLYNASNGWKLLALFDIVKGMAGRYLFFLIIASTRRYAAIVGALMIAATYAYTLRAAADDFTFSAGYRITEYVLVWDAIQECGYAFGCILGDPFTEYKLGTKGVVSVSGHFHNYWLICLYNLGFVGLMGVLFTFVSIVRKMGKYWFVGAAYGFMMLLDSPRDGHWVFGFLAGVIIYEHSLYLQRRAEGKDTLPAPPETA